MKSILLAGRDCPLSVPEGEIPPGGFSLILSNDGDMPAADFEAIFAHIKQQNCVFLAVPPMDRDREYTPWPAPALSQKAPAFSGQGGDYTAIFDKNTPAGSAQGPARHSRPRPHNAGGLLARRLARPLERHAVRGVWADRLSPGSLWYDGAAEYFRSHPLNPAVRRVYLSLGTAEEKARNPRMARVGDCTREIHQLLKGHGVSCTLEWNPGGHFRAIPERFLRAIDWLCGQSF